MTNMDMSTGNSANQEHDFAELSDNEINDVSGGILPIVIGVVWAVAQIELAVIQREVCAS